MFNIVSKDNIEHLNIWMFNIFPLDKMYIIVPQYKMFKIAP